MLVDRYALAPGTDDFAHEGSDWCVAEGLKRLGHETFAAEYTTLRRLLAVIEERRPDVVFNLTQRAHGDREKDAHLCAMFELLGLPYTGATARGLVLGRDKAASSAIAAHCGFAVPRSFVVGPGQTDVPRDLPLPMVVKPRFGDASEGVSAGALVETRRALVARIALLRSRRCADLVCEEFIPGRELTIGVVHDRMLPPRELLFDRDAPGAPRLATTAFKYDAAFRTRWRVRTEEAALGRAERTRLAALVRRTSRALEMRDYGRIDVRRSAAGEWVFLEANPNPGLSPPKRNWVGTWDSVAFDPLLASIVERAIRRGGRPRRGRSA